MTITIQPSTLVVAAVWFVFKFLRKSGAPAADDDTFLRNVAGVTLSPGKSVHIVTLVDKAYMLGVSESGVNLIDKIDDKDLVDAMNLYNDKKTSSKKPRNFAEVLDIFMPGSSSRKEKNASVFDSSTDDMIDSLGSKHLPKEEKNRDGE